MSSGLADRGCTRDAYDMFAILAPLAAVIVALPPRSIRHGPSHHRYSVHKRHRVASRTRPAAALGAAVGRMTRLALLQERAALLHDFLVRANTETLLFHDERTSMPAPGVLINAVVVSRDLIGSPIIRARVTSRRPASASLVLIADLKAKNGVGGRASVALLLRSGETRTVELFCPSTLIPVSLRWSALML